MDTLLPAIDSLTRRKASYCDVRISTYFSIRQECPQLNRKDLWRLPPEVHEPGSTREIFSGISRENAALQRIAEDICLVMQVEFLHDAAAMKLHSARTEY